MAFYDFEYCSLGFHFKVTKVPHVVVADFDINILGNMIGTNALFGNSNRYGYMLGLAFF